MSKKNNNRIPRKFNSIKGKILIKTNMDQPGDILHIYKNDCGTGYLAYNTRTNKHAYIFPSMLRNAEIFEIMEIA